MAITHPGLGCSTTHPPDHPATVLQPQAAEGHSLHHFGGYSLLPFAAVAVGCSGDALAATASCLFAAVAGGCSGDALAATASCLLLL